MSEILYVSNNVCVQHFVWITSPYLKRENAVMYVYIEATENINTVWTAISVKCQHWF